MLTVIRGHDGPEHPGQGNPCNGCGLCCTAHLCWIAKSVFAGIHTIPELRATVVPGPCPALEKSGDRYVCGLMTNPVKYVPQLVARYTAGTLTAAAKYYLVSGVGCDTLMYGEKPDPEIDAKFAAARNPQSAAAAGYVWGILHDPAKR